ncbi:MAG: calcium-binding protein, partial [Cyanobacteria bacterium P01_H01_bin.130]
MAPELRCEALIQCLTALRTTYSSPQFILEVGNRRAMPANTNNEHHVDIIVCTTQDFHLLSQLKFPPDFLTHYNTDIEPMALGFKCQELLKENLGKKYDYYCYLEDDLILHDPRFFVKLQWFTDLLGSGNLLQPNRYEASTACVVQKAYIDGDLKPEVTRPFQDIQDYAQIQGSVMGKPILFQRPANPHSGCYFLNH